jgi:predicted permease
MRSLLDDLKYALRLLAKSPGFAAAAVLTLALAIGANTAIFSVANGILLAPPPFPEPDRLAEVLRKFPQGVVQSVSPTRYFHWLENSKAFADLAVYDDIGSGFNLTGDGKPERIVGSRVSKGFFHVLRVDPAQGRSFVAEEDAPGGPRAVVLSDALWHSRWGGDPKTIGKTIELNGEGYTVVGIMPPTFRYPTTAELWTPLRADPADSGAANYLRLIGRLAPGKTLQSAVAEAPVLNKSLAKRYPDLPLGTDESATVESLQKRLGGDVRPALLILLGAVGCVLLIACVNIANLQLARGAARQRELAIRSALGAGARRIARQLLTESLLLALLGGALGVGLGALAIRPLLALSPVPLNPLTPIEVNGTVLGFALGLSLIAGLLFGLAPALQVLRSKGADPLREGAGRVTLGKKGLLARRLLVVGEVALALVLLVGASLLAKSFVGMLGTNPGFNPDGVLTQKISLPEGRYGDPAALERFAQAISERAAALPGVRGAAFTSSLPLEGGPDMFFAVEGRDPNADDGGIDPQVRFVSVGYFATMGIPILRGRGFNAGDTAAGAPVVILNQAAAKKIWPKGDALGRRLIMGSPKVPELSDLRPRPIVGIVGDVRETGLQQDPPPVAYVAVGQVPQGLLTLLVRLLPASFVVRAEGSPGALAAPVAKAIWSVDPDLPVTNVLTLREVLRRSVGSDSWNAALLGLLALAALALSAIGIYGVLSFLVEQRTREIGVRMALGANAREVTGLVLRQGGAPVIVGLAIGLGGAFALTRYLESLVYGISVRDPLAFVLGATALGSVALLASFVPARRASRLDPLVALRRD